MTYRLSDRPLRNRIVFPTPASRLAVSVATHMAGGGLVTLGAASALSGHGGLPESYTGYVAACYALVAALMMLHLSGHAPHARFGPLLDLHEQAPDRPDRPVEPGGLGALKVGEEPAGPGRQMTLEEALLRVGFGVDF